jgi:hypothetical protein
MVCLLTLIYRCALTLLPTLGSGLLLYSSASVGIKRVVRDEVREECCRCCCRRVRYLLIQRERGGFYTLVIAATSFRVPTPLNF